LQGIRDVFGKCFIPARGCRWQGFSVLLIEFYGLLNDVAQLRENLFLIAAMATTIKQAGTTADKAPVFVGSFHNLWITMGFAHYR
jgi:hypothetical protein